MTDSDKLGWKVLTLDSLVGGEDCTSGWRSGELLRDGARVRAVGAAVSGRSCGVGVGGTVMYDGM